jgi:hypothetical protein
MFLVRTTGARTRQAAEPLNLVHKYKKQFQCESGRAMEQAVQRNQRSKKCPAVQKIAEERVEIVGCKGKKKIG